MSKAKQAKWESMTPTERKVAIAKDVIAQIHTKKYKVATGAGYIAPIEGTEAYDSLRKHFKEVDKWNKPVSDEDVKVLTKHCTLCARGAALISRVRKFNQLTRDDLNIVLTDDNYHPIYGDETRKVADVEICTKQTDTTDGLDGSFTETELEMIECAFECNPYFCDEYSKGFPLAELEQAVTFGEQFEDASDRLLAIMQNIVDNDGVFRPEQKYEIVSY